MNTGMVGKVPRDLTMILWISVGVSIGLYLSHILAIPLGIAVIVTVVSLMLYTWLVYRMGDQGWMSSSAVAVGIPAIVYLALIFTTNTAESALDIYLWITLAMVYGVLSNIVVFTIGGVVFGHQWPWHNPHSWLLEDVLYRAVGVLLLLPAYVLCVWLMIIVAGIVGAPLSIATAVGIMLASLVVFVHYSIVHDNAMGVILMLWWVFVIALGVTNVPLSLSTVLHGVVSVLTGVFVMLFVVTTTGVGIEFMTSGSVR